MIDIRNIIGRNNPLFINDEEKYSCNLKDAICGSRIIVFGGAGSIGRAVVKQLFLRKPSALHVVDISENNLVELVRDLRSSFGYIDGDTQFLPLDMAGPEVVAFVKSQGSYDYILNLAAMKHVRSEKDPYSLMRMIRTNIYDTLHTLGYSDKNTKKFFAVSTDKAKNPANLMGASKRIMEDVLFGERHCKPIVSTARFANVAFSDGSLLQGFQQRFLLKQPIAAPSDVKRYFVTGEESGLLCLLSTVLGEERDIFFPKLDEGLDLLTFSEIACRFIESSGYEPYEVHSEDEARSRASELISCGKWPCYFFRSDTSGEKAFEEFYSDDDIVEWSRFRDIGIIKVPPLEKHEQERVHDFFLNIAKLLKDGNWTRSELIQTITRACPGLDHVETGKFLDNRM